MPDRCPTDARPIPGPHSDRRHKPSCPTCAMNRSHSRPDADRLSAPHRCRPTPSPRRGSALPAHTNSPQTRTGAIHPPRPFSTPIADRHHAPCKTPPPVPSLFALISPFGPYLVRKISPFSFVQFHGISGYRYEVPVIVLVVHSMTSSSSTAAANPRLPPAATPTSIPMRMNLIA